MEHLTQFQGAGGALIVSLIAFTIVFIVLAGLTAVIYAIKFFAGDSEEKGQNTPSAPKTAVTAPTAPAASGSVASGGKAKITAAITAAIVAATGGRGRVLNIIPVCSQTGSMAFDSTRTWKVTGVVERISGRLARSWKH